MIDGDNKKNKDSILNVNCPATCGKEAAFCRPCLPAELLNNGGFEEPGAFATFADWDEFEADIVIQSNGTAYEGTLSAQFVSVPTPAFQTKTASLRQNVTVTPSCFLALNFAENFNQSGTGFNDLDVTARVFYIDGGEVNLINIEIDYDADQSGGSFVFHYKVSDHPVPFNVTSVTVEFFVQIRDVGSPLTTSWLLDGVSLRAV